MVEVFEIHIKWLKYLKFIQSGEEVFKDLVEMPIHSPALSRFHWPDKGHPGFNTGQKKNL